MSETYITNIINEYNDILSEKRKKFSSTCFDFGKKQNEVLAVRLFKYAIEHYLKWTPLQAADNLSEIVIQNLKLNQVINYINFPRELNPKKDYWYIVHLCYPNIVKCNKKDLIINMYKDVIENNQKFPRDYFMDADALIKAAVCLQYVLQYYYGYKSIEEFYNDFANIDKISNVLNNYKLLKICECLFPSPLDYLHYSLPDANKNDFLYHYYKFMDIKSEVIKQGYIAI